MSYPETEIDKIGVELHDLARAYAQKAAGLASDPYFRAAIQRVAVTSFVWALYDAFDDHERDTLLGELKEQTAAVGRAVGSQQGGLN